MFCFVVVFFWLAARRAMLTRFFFSCAKWAFYSRCRRTISRGTADSISSRCRSTTASTTGAYNVSLRVPGVRSAITPEQRAIPKYKFCVMGLLDSVAGIMGVFAVNYINNAAMIVLLQQAAIPISMSISKLFLGARYTVSQVYYAKKNGFTACKPAGSITRVTRALWEVLQAPWPRMP